MVGRIRYMRGKGKETVSMAQIGVLAMMTATLYEPEGCSERRMLTRLRRTERLLCRRGVGRVILSDGFPYTERLERLRPVETLTFYRGTADILAMGWLNHQGISPKEGRIALAAPRLCPELRGTAERLCAQVKELVIRVPEAGENYAHWLHRTYGIPEMPDFVKAHLTVAFGPTQGGGMPTMKLFGEQPDLCGLKLTARGLSLPADCEQPILALLWEAGQLDRRELAVTKCLQTLANE